MQRLSSLTWRAGLLALALLLNGCGGRSVNKKLARDVIIGSPAEALAQQDVEVLSVTQAGAQEAVVETTLHTAFRMEKVGNKWVVREVRVGHGQWEKLDDILRVLQQIKIEETRQFLEKVAAAIEDCRQKTTRLPEFKDYVGLSDALYPTYLSPLIRNDAWDQPLVAIRVSLDTIRLISIGPDHTLGTADDIQLTRTFR